MADKSFYQIQVQTQEDSEVLTCSASQGDVLLEALNAASIEIDQSCGGNGTCGTCRYFLIQGELEPRGELELEMASERGFSQSERLACQTLIQSDLVISLAKS